MKFMKNYTVICTLGIAFYLVQPTLTYAGQLRYDSARQWEQWELPIGAVELQRTGTISPKKISKDTDAITDIAAHNGGIRNAGSNLREATNVIDGDISTGWRPSMDDDPSTWFIEVDLGRGVSAKSVTLIFDKNSPPFELFDLLLSTGEPETDKIAAPIPGTLVYRVKQRFKENNLHSVTFEIDKEDETPIQFIRFEPLLLKPDSRLVEVKVTTIGDNIALGMIERGGTVDININLANTESQPLGNAIGLVDGDLYARWRAGTASRGLNDILAHMILDLGAVYWIDQVRVIGGVVVRSGFGGGITTSHYISRRRWDFRFYEFMTSDGSISTDGSRRYTKHFSGASPYSDYSNGIVDHHFDLLPTQYVRIFWKYWDTSCYSLNNVGDTVSGVTGCAAGGTTDEIQIFGNGYPQQVSFSSPLIDLGQGRNLNSVDWGGDIPPGTRVEIRTRTGNDVVEEYQYYDKNGKAVSEKRYGKLIPSFRGRIDTSISPGGDWSSWSKLYSESGAAFQSPSPRRYMEIDVSLVSNTPDLAANLDFLAVNYTSPLAERAIGEITPNYAVPGEPTEFTYFMLPEKTNGFDRILLQSTTPIEFVSLSLAGVEVDANSTNTDSGILIDLPKEVSKDQMVELRFKSSVFVQSTRFDMFLQNSKNTEDVRQRVDPGDADGNVESNQITVDLPVTQSLLSNTRFNTLFVTPNEDGINDQLRIDLGIVNVIQERPLRFRVLDLAGRILFENVSEGIAGQQTLEWNGVNNFGQRVAPGLYLAEISIAGDAGEEIERRLISVLH
jgi:hypothetical protein